MKFDDLPIIPEALEWWRRKMITDRQTSGGLLVACAPDAENEVPAEFARRGFTQAKKIGSLAAGAATITVV